MYETLRDSFVGQIVRVISGSQFFRHDEELPGFILPHLSRNSQCGSTPEDTATARDRRCVAHDPGSTTIICHQGQRSEANDHCIRENEERGCSAETVVDDILHVSGRGKRADVESKESDLEAQSQEVTPEPIATQSPLNAVLGEDHIIVTWYSDNDPANPQNWSLGKKCWTTLTIMLITFTIYMGSAIFTPAIASAMEYFGLGQVTVTLGIALFVIGYGIGPLILAPISEIPQIGRTIPYIITLFVFTVLQIPTALVTNFAGFAILRFVAGFVGSPPLATGGASLSDILAPHKLPYAMGLYGVAAVSAPALGPILAAFAVESDHSWRWPFWIQLWLSAGTLILLAFLLPETSADNILLRRAKRLRKLTANENFVAASEIAASDLSGSQIIREALLRPLMMTCTEPVILATDLYLGLVYAVLYSYFESFPLVYEQGYGWSLGISSLPFASLQIGAALSYTGYATWNWLYFEPRWRREREAIRPETRLPMLIAGAVAFPLCLFWFAWSANRTSWVAPALSTVLFGLGVPWSFMPILTYLPHAYPAYAASALASNDFVRSLIGGVMPLAANPLFKNLGVDWGNTLLGCVALLFIPLPFLLIRFGPALRTRSPNAVHDIDLRELALQNRGREMKR